MKVIGLDTSLTSTGVAVIDNGKIATVTSVKSSGKRDATLKERRDRLVGIVRGIRKAAGEFTYHYADLLVIESPSFGSKYGSAHDRSGLWWFVVDEFTEMGIPVAQVAPTARAKYLTGTGKASKSLVVEIATATYGMEFSCDDEADALGLAAMGSRHLGNPVEQSLAAKQLEAFEGVTWPST